MAECRRRLSQPTTTHTHTHTHTHTRIASPFFETGPGRASLVADFGVVALAHYDPSYSEGVQRLSNTSKYAFSPPIPAPFTHYQLPSPRTPIPSRCADSGLYRRPADALGSWSSLSVLVLPQSRTPPHVLVYASPGSTIAPTRPSSVIVANDLVTV
ncbi:hypothetical protein D9619_006159 [Psilocybe cf. subviscida]|uniref:Uncharacterized protein n=1 Tax=Psilocybe cf. subviscida TaxID=2480587 RepID=A0A8H5B410_9AGAR|nr:hypothetical protein D9619_006159 [Psilocybe cf. subviscida]